MANIEKDYALYYGDELVFVGTMKEMADFTNKRIETLYTYGNKRYKDRNTYLSFLFLLLLTFPII